MISGRQIVEYRWSGMRVDLKLSLMLGRRGQCSYIRSNDLCEILRLCRGLSKEKDDWREGT